MNAAQRRVDRRRKALIVTLRPEVLMRRTWPSPVRWIPVKPIRVVQTSTRASLLEVSHPGRWRSDDVEFRYASLGRLRVGSMRC